MAQQVCVGKLIFVSQIKSWGTMEWCHLHRAGVGIQMQVCLRGKTGSFLSASQGLPHHGLFPLKMGIHGERRSTKCNLQCSPVKVQLMLHFPQVLLFGVSGTVSKLLPEALAAQWCVFRAQFERCVRMRWVKYGRNLPAFKTPQRGRLGGSVG